MTKKDYKTLAACLGLAYAEGYRQKESETWFFAVMDVFRRIALECELENPRFSRDKFLAMVDKVSRENTK